MAAAIVSQPRISQTALPYPDASKEHRALLVNLYSEEAVKQAHLRLQAMLAFQNVRPKTDSRTGRQLPTQLVLESPVRSTTQHLVALVPDVQARLPLHPG